MYTANFIISLKSGYLINMIFYIQTPVCPRLMANKIMNAIFKKYVSQYKLSKI